MSIACAANFFFAHRVWFFFNSSLDPNHVDDRIKTRTVELLSKIEHVCYEGPEELYLANSEEIVALSRRFHP